MASLIVWLCVHVSKFNTVCVVEHRGGIRAAERQQSSSRAAAEQQQSSSRAAAESSSRAAAEQQQSIPYLYGWCTPQSRSSRAHTIRKRFQYAKTLYNNWYNICPQHGGHNTPFQLVS